MFRNRFPSGRELTLAFASCLFPVFSWSVLFFLKRLPYWLLFLSAWDLVGAFAYTTAFALLEGILVLLGLVLLGAILPTRLWRQRFVAHGTVFVLLTSAWIILDHLQVIWFFGSPLWPLLYLVSLGATWALIFRYNRLEKAIDSLAERLTVLLYVYIPIAFLGFVIVILRNIQRSI